MSDLVLKPATILGVVGAALLMLACEVRSQDVPPLPEDKIEAADARSDAAGIENSRDFQKRKQQSAVAGLLMLGLLCGVFLFLILVVVFWARRIRLESTQPLPDQQPGDPLWYLKKPSAISDASTSGFDGEET
jgi:hypothetical protein